jgi:Di- and tricarboxylate transporters
VITEAEDRFERIRRTVGLFLAPAIFLILYFLPLPSLTPQAHKLLAIVAFTVTCWITECIPIPVAALLGPTLAVIFQVEDAKAVYAPFADPIIILLLGSFIIAKAMSVQGLDRRFAFEILSIKSVSRRATSVSLGVALVVAVISMWVSNSATTAMMFPVALGILSVLNSIMAETKEKGVGDGRYATGLMLIVAYAASIATMCNLSAESSPGLMLIVAYAASIGGISTPVGTPPNLITLGMLEQLVDVEIDFLRWMAVGVPIALIMLVFLWLYMSLVCPPAVKELKGFSSFILEEKKKLGEWKRGEINVLIAFAVAVILWIAPGFLSIFLGTDSPVYETYDSSLPESVVAIIAACLLFMLPTDRKEREFTLSIRDAMYIDWGTLLLFGGGLSLGTLMFKTGLAEVIGKYSYRPYRRRFARLHNSSRTLSCRCAFGDHIKHGNRQHASPAHNRHRRLSRNKPYTSCHSRRNRGKLRIHASRLHASERYCLRLRTHSDNKDDEVRICD